MKDFHCSDTGMKCDFVARGELDDDLLGKARAHAERDHQMPLTPDLESRIRSLIHDEKSPEHERSMQNAKQLH